jgi:hypothetical protein
VSSPATPTPTPAIPPFNISGVLPPYKSTVPTDPTGVSPYRATLVELVQRFASTKPRAAIARGFLNYRKALIGVGVAGFQWVAGSYTEEIERIESRDPKDVDLVTYFRRPMSVRDAGSYSAFATSLQPLLTRSHTKATYKCDAFAVDLDTGVAAWVVDQTSYWFGLFTHRRTSHLWKGIVEVPLTTVADDNAADTELTRIENSL